MSDTTKGNIEGKAQAISKLLGSADIGGTIETERKTIYQTSDASEALRNDRYLFYVTCVLLMKDTTMPLQNKLDAIKALRQPISTGPAKGELMQKLLADFNSDMPIEKFHEVFGAPISRSEISLGDGSKKHSYVLERYKGDYADLFLIGDSPLVGIAISLRDDEQTPKGILPIPYYVIEHGNEYTGLGDLTLNNKGQLLWQTFQYWSRQFFFMS